MHTAEYKILVRKYKDLVYSQALYSTGNRHDAADITQEVLIKLWKNKDKIRPQTVKSWLFTVTRNSCIDVSRKKREHCFSELYSKNEANSPDRIACDSKPDPEQSFNEHERQRRVISAINGLPEKIRTALILRYIHDESYEVIAETLESPINSIKVYLHRGRKLLARKLGETIQE